MLLDAAAGRPRPFAVVRRRRWRHRAARSAVRADCRASSSSATWPTQIEVHVVEGELGGSGIEPGDLQQVGEQRPRTGRVLRRAVRLDRAGSWRRTELPVARSSTSAGHPDRRQWRPAVRGRRRRRSAAGPGRRGPPIRRSSCRKFGQPCGSSTVPARTRSSVLRRLTIRSSRWPCGQPFSAASRAARTGRSTCIDDQVGHNTDARSVPRAGTRRWRTSPAGRRRGCPAFLRWWGRGRRSCSCACPGATRVDATTSPGSDARLSVNWIRVGRAPQCRRPCLGQPPGCSSGILSAAPARPSRSPRSASPARRSTGCPVWPRFAASRPSRVIRSPSDVVRRSVVDRVLPACSPPQRTPPRRSPGSCPSMMPAGGLVEQEPAGDDQDHDRGRSCWSSGPPGTATSAGPELDQARSGRGHCLIRPASAHRPGNRCHGP